VSMKVSSSAPSSTHLATTLSQ
jgi:carbon dioxide concentrating mechanism protein CcmN